MKESSCQTGAEYHGKQEEDHGNCSHKKSKRRILKDKSKVM